jgi:hypothetical protein
MRNVCTIALAALVLGVGTLSAANSAKITGIPHTITTPGVTPATVNVGFLASAVLVGTTDPEGVVPCFNCVSGPDIQTLLVAVPLSAVFEGSSITIMVIGDDLFYGGNASFTYSIKANPTVAPVSTGTVAGTVSPGVWFAQFPIAAPAAGYYVLEGDIATGEGLKNHTKVTSHLLIGAGTGN